MRPNHACSNYTRSEHTYDLDHEITQFIKETKELVSNIEDSTSIDDNIKVIKKAVLTEIIESL